MPYARAAQAKNSNNAAVANRDHRPTRLMMTHKDFAAYLPLLP